MTRARLVSVIALPLLITMTAGCGVAVGDAASEPAATPGPAAAISATPSPSPSSSSSPSLSATPGQYIDFTDGAIETIAGPKALFFHAGWCPQCRALDEDLRTNGAPDGLTVLKVDFDSRTDLRQRYGVTLQTTVVFVDDAGELVSSAVLYDDPSVASLAAAIP